MNPEGARPAIADTLGLLRALSGAGVRYLVVGGVAGVIHGAARATYDLDVLYARDAGNLAALAAAMAPLRPYLRGAPAGLPFTLDAGTLGRGLNFTLVSDLGPIDLLGEIPGVGGYDSAAADSVVREIEGLPVHVLSLPALVRAKRAAGRPKDIEAIAELEALAEFTAGD